MMKGFINSKWFGKGNSESSSLKHDANRSSQTVLVVEDSKTQLFATKKMLEEFGYTVLTAENGKIGILKAREHKPNIILMDIVMPEVNGFQATRYLTRHPETANIPIIIVSSSTQEADKAWGLKLGACDFVTKPIERNILLRKILRHIDSNQLSYAAGH